MTVKPSEAPTVKAKRTPVILVVGFDAAFVRRCQLGAADTHASVVGIEAGGESHYATHTLPIAVVIRKNAVASSPLATIARELGIELVTIDDDTLPDPALSELLHGAVSRAQSRVKPIAR